MEEVADEQGHAKFLADKIITLIVIYLRKMSV
jgi:hypothetical protein